jgi:molecular chaperone DnaK (HSP70)
VFLNPFVWNPRAPTEKMEDDFVVDFGFDYGTTSITVAFNVCGSEETHLLQFQSQSAAKDSNELPATVVWCRNRWHYGPDATHEPGAVVFTDVKSGINGRTPFTEQMWRAFNKVNSHTGVRESPVSLLTNLLQYILNHLEKEIREHPKYCTLLGDRSFSCESVKKRCWVTYPVRQSDSLHLTLVQAARAAGCEVHGVSESVAAAYYGVLKDKVKLRASSTILIADVGGSTTVCGWIYLTDLLQF